MRISLLISKVSLPLLLMVLLGACSRYIEGSVFLDKNANNVKDMGEEVVSNIPFTVTLNNAVFKTGATDAGGHFLVTMDNSSNSANYCVQVSSNDIATFDLDNSQVAKALQNATATPEPTANVCPKNAFGNPDCNNANCCDNALCEQATICKDKNACSKLVSGEPDCTDTDCCSESACSTAAACKSGTKTCPNGSDGKPDCNDSRCSGESACNTHTVKSMQACDTSKASTMKLTLDVPIGVDYSARVAKISNTYPALVVPGDKIGIEITYPSSCTFEPYTLPSVFVPVNLGDAYDATTHELSLAKAVAERPSQLITKDFPPFGNDRLFTYVLPLNAVADENLKDADYTIQPTVTCPDGQKILASATLIHFKASQLFSLRSEISPDCPALGETAMISATIGSHASKSYAGSTLTVAIGEGDGNLTLGALPSNCRNKGSAIECDLASLDPGSKATVSFPFTMAASVPSATTISFMPKLGVNGLEITDTPISCSYP